MLKQMPGEIAMLDLIRVVIRDEGGATSIEYGLVAALISLASFAAYVQLGSSVRSFFFAVNRGLTSVSTGS